MPPEPIITFIGLTRSDDSLISPSETLPDGTLVFDRDFGSGFSIVIEGRRGGTNAPLEERTFQWHPANPGLLPGVQLIVSQPLGDGSLDVCDDTGPSLGGVPATVGLFDGSQGAADAINDFSCRFKNGFGDRRGREPDSACTVSDDGFFRFVDAASQIQYCGLVNNAIAFPAGDTRVAVRIQDTQGNRSEVSEFILRVAP